MKKLIENVKNYFGLEQSRVGSVGNYSYKWKKLAVELNNELQAERRVKNSLVEEVQRLQAIVDCQGELLAERKV